MFYYLDNFRTALRCLLQRYGELLSAAERQFIDQFDGLAPASQALLVRLIMRKGGLFRESKIAYAEIGCIAAAAQSLIELHWLDPDPALTLEELFGLLTRAELAAIFGGLQRAVTKGEALAILRPLYPKPRSFGHWSGHDSERVLRVSVARLCARLRILFFGNFRQDWCEFVLADLQVLKYEAVDSSLQSRAFHRREEIEQFYALHDCRQKLFDQQAPDDALALIPGQPIDNPWLEARRARLLFQIAREYERQHQTAEALQTYARCGHPGARLKSLRIMERSGDYSAALKLAEAATVQPESEAERQQLRRVLARLCRRLALPAPCHPRPLKPERLDVSLSQPTAVSVERALLAHLTTPAAPVYYVENTLINSLFGLLCWEAIFAPIGGAFFHPFHSGPADLWSPTFYCRRQKLFERCLGRLDDGSYPMHIRQMFGDKQDIQSPFVFWGALNAQLLDTALHCIPALHLRRCCERLLLDLRENRAGLPDLIQFWPLERRYRMIEVKGPGDRLQDNQRRWLDYCHSVDIPVTVCHVHWTHAAA